MLSSRVESFSAPRYSSSIVAGGSKDRDWKNGVVGSKLLMKFYKTASILYMSICWTAYSNLREVPDGLVFAFEDCLEGANVPLLPDRT